MADRLAAITDRLASRLAEAAAEDAVEVVIELCPSDPRASDMSRPRADLAAEGRREFARRSRSVVQDVLARGGTLIDSAWVNSTLKAVVPADQVVMLAEYENVERVDLPSRL